MAVLGWAEDFKARKGEGTISQQPRKFVRTYTRRFIVRTSDVRDGPVTVLTAPGLPQQLDFYVSGNDFDLAAYCIKGTATPRQDAPTVWDAVFEYTTDTPAPDHSDPNKTPQNDPTKRGVRYGMGYTTISRVLDYDPVRNIPLINSAGEKFDPPFEREVYLTVLTVQRAETSLFVLKPSPNFCGYVNTNDFTVNKQKVAAGTALAHIRQTEIYESAAAGTGQPLSYFDTVYEFIINPDGWKLKPLDQGTRKRVAGKSGQVYASDGKFVTITDAFGQPLNHAVNLDGQGQPLDPSKDPVFLDGTHDRHTDFGPFNQFLTTAFPASF